MRLVRPDCVRLGAMKRMLWLIVFVTGCGYHFITWDNPNYHSIYIRPVQTQTAFQPHASLFQHALADRCLAISGLDLVDQSTAHLVLETTLNELAETIIATDVDRRVKQVQFTLNSSFRLRNKEGEVLWSMENYRFSDQYEISTSKDTFQNDAAASLDKAFRSVAEMVVTHFSISLNRREQPGE